MTEERIVETRAPDGATHTHTTVVTDGGQKRSGASTLIMLVVAALVVLVAIWAFSSMGGAEVAKDNAIADAASDVGAAAGEVGEAAQDAASSITN